MGLAGEALAVTGQINGLRTLFPDPESQQILDSPVELVPQLEDRATARKKSADQLDRSG